MTRNGLSAAAEGAVRDEDVFPDRVLLGAAGVSVLLALGLLLLVAAGPAAAIDTWLFDLVHVGVSFTPANAPPWLNEAVRDVTALGSGTILTGAVIAACSWMLAAGRTRLFVLTLASAIGATIFSTVVKFTVARARPDTVEHMVSTATASFPSGHALLTAAIILSIGGLMAFAAKKPVERRVIMTASLVVTILVGASRVWLGVHWPIDVLAGWLFGSAWAAITLWLAKRIDRQGQKPSPRKAIGTEPERL
jgi:undecaprenyl-diphosphatase